MECRVSDVKQMHMCVLGVLKEKKGGFLGSEKKGRKISQTLQSAKYIRLGGGSRI